MVQKILEGFSVRVKCTKCPDYVDRPFDMMCNCSDLVRHGRYTRVSTDSSEETIGIYSTYSVRRILNTKSKVHIKPQVVFSYLNNLLDPIRHFYLHPHPLFGNVCDKKVSSKIPNQANKRKKVQKYKTTKVTTP